MKDKKEHWVERMLTSLDSLSEAELNSQLFFKIKARIADLENAPMSTRISRPILFVGASAFALLLFANVELWQYSSSDERVAVSASGNIRSLITEYDMAPKNSIYNN